jgi:hypothetical protein
MTAKKQISSLTEKIPNNPAVVDMKTFDEVKAIPLTDKERAELSRKKILEWFRAKRYEKLKALRDEIRGSTLEEEKKLKNKIIQQTETDLKELNKDLNIEQRKEIAEKFSEKLFNAAYQENFDDILGDITQETREERLFFTLLGTYGSLKWVKHLKSLKNQPILQKLFQKKPSLENEFDRLVEEGDYEKLSDFLFNASPEVKEWASKEQVQNMLILISDRGSGAAEQLGQIPGIGEWLKLGVEFLEKTKQLADIGFYKKVAEKLNVKLSNVVNTSSMTYIELHERDRIFQKYKYLLEELRETTESKSKRKKAERQLQYINDLHIIAENVKKVREENSELIRKGIKKYIDKDKDLTDNDKIKILTELNMDSLRVHSFLPVIVYGAEGVDERVSVLQWVGRSLSHYTKFKTAYKFASGLTYGKLSSYEAAIARAQINRLYSKNTIRFRQELRRYKDIDNLMNNKIKSFSEQIDTYSTATEGRGTGALAEDMGRHDDLMRQYYALSNKMSELMTNKSQELINVGAKLDKEMKGLKKGAKTISKSRFSARELEVLGLKKAGKQIGIESIQRAYTDKLIGLRSLRDTAQTEFARLGNELDKKVISKFENTWAGQRNIEELRRSMLKETGEIKRFQMPGGRLRWMAKKAALPLISVSIPVIDAIRSGKNFNLKRLIYDSFDAISGFIPIIGTLVDFKQAFFGETTSGRKLSFRERILSGVFGVVGAISDVAWALGGLGAVMRGGIGALRAGRKLSGAARTGKNLFNTLDVVQDAKRITWAQKGARKIWSFFGGLSKSATMHRYAKSAAKADMLDFYRFQNKLKKAGRLEDYKDYLKGGKKFGQLSEQSDLYKAMQKYRKLTGETAHGVDYYDTLRKSYGYVDDIPTNFLSGRSTMTKFWNKVRKSFIGKEGVTAESMKNMKRVVGRYDDLVAQRTKLIQKLDSMPKSSGQYKIAARNLKNVDDKISSFLRAETELFGKAEKLARTNMYMTNAARYLTYGGFAMGGIWLLTGENPVSKKAMETAYETVKTPVEYTAKSAVKLAGLSTVYRYKEVKPIEQLINDYKQDRLEEKDFTEKLAKLEDPNNKDPDKKRKIEELCAEYWNNCPHVQSWAYRHKDKLDIRRIIKVAKEQIVSGRQRLMRQMQRMKGVRPGNIDLMPGMAKGPKAIENL